MFFSVYLEFKWRLYNSVHYIIYKILQNTKKFQQFLSHFSYPLIAFAWIRICIEIFAGSGSAINEWRSATLVGAHNILYLINSTVYLLAPLCCSQPQKTDPLNNSVHIFIYSGVYLNSGRRLISGPSAKTTIL